MAKRKAKSEPQTTGGWEFTHGETKFKLDSPEAVQRAHDIIMASPENRAAHERAVAERDRHISSKQRQRERDLDLERQRPGWARNVLAMILFELRRKSNPDAPKMKHQLGTTAGAWDAILHVQRSKDRGLELMDLGAGSLADALAAVFGTISAAIGQCVLEWKDTEDAAEKISAVGRMLADVHSLRAEMDRLGAALRRPETRACEGRDAKFSKTGAGQADVDAGGGTASTGGNKDNTGDGGTSTATQNQANHESQIPKVTPEMSGEARAIAALIKHPEWTDKRIAEAVGLHPKSLYRYDKYKAARRMVKEAGKEELPRGHKSRDGGIEAYSQG